MEEMGGKRTPQIFEGRDSICTTGIGKKLNSYRPVFCVQKITLEGRIPGNQVPWSSPSSFSCLGSEQEARSQIASLPSFVTLQLSSVPIGHPHQQPLVIRASLRYDLQRAIVNWLPPASPGQTGAPELHVANEEN